MPGRIRKKTKKFFKNLWPIRIWQQVFLVLVPLVVVPLIILGVLLINTSQRAIQKGIYQNGEELARRAAGEVNEFIKKPLELLTVTSSMLSVLDEDAWRQETALVELSLAYPMFRRISFIGMNGRATASSELGDKLKDRSLETAFLEARAGRAYTSELKISDDGPIPVLMMAVPVRHGGLVKGALVADVNIRGFWDIIDGIRVGETGQAFAVNQYGSLLSHPDKKRVLENKQFGYERFLSKIKKGESGVYETKGRDHQWIEFYAPIEKTGWGLIIFQDRNEAYQTSRMMKMQSMLLIFAGILIALLISFILAPIVSRPVVMLVKGAKRIIKGNFDDLLEVKRADEMGLLLNSFNKIMRKFKKVQQAEKLSVIGTAATAIVHELKNSLILVNTYIQLLAERYQDKKFIMEFSRIVPQELSAWKGMLQNVIDYSKMHQFSISELDINALIRDIAILAEARVRQHQAQLFLEIEKNLPLVRGNGEKLKQVLLNLLSNALEAVPDGGRIIIRTKFFPGLRKNEKPAVIVEVHNNGEWISPEKAKQLFEPFYSTKTDGLGLGLAVSKEIIVRHEGTIDIKSFPGKGAAFVVKIPLAEKN